MIVELAIPGTLVLLMVVVGLDLTASDFRRVAAHPGAVVLGTLGQLVLLPAIVLLLVIVFDPPPFLVAGMIVIGACPGGALSNLYVYLARADTALSVSLTAVSTLISIVTLPLLLAAGFALLLGDQAAVEVPAVATMKQLVVYLLLPVGMGMALRHRYPAVAAKHGSSLRRLSAAAIVALLGFIVYDQHLTFADYLKPVTLAAVLFTGLSMAGGYAIAWLANIDGSDRFTLLAEYSTRNLAIAATVAVTILGRLDFLAFAAAFLVIQVPMLLAAIGIFRAVQRRVLDPA